MILRRKPIKAQSSWLTNDPHADAYSKYNENQQYNLRFDNQALYGNTGSLMTSSGLLNNNQQFTSTGSKIYNSLLNTGGKSTGFTNGISNQITNSFGIDNKQDITASDAANTEQEVDSASPSKVAAFSEAGLAMADAGLFAINGKYDRKAEKFSKTDSFDNEIIDQGYVDRENKRSAWNDIGGGIAKGAASGAAFGGVGAAVGGLVGGIGGIFNHKKHKKENALAKEEYEKTFDRNLRSYNRNQDLQLSQMLYAKKGMKLGKFHFNHSPSKALKMKSGGKLEEPGAVNIVAKGKMHRENNDLGNKDKGIPIINKDGVKEYEIEAGEIIFRQDATNKIEDFVKKYDESKDDKVFEDFGKYLATELLKNTHDNYGKFKVKVKEDAA